MSIDLYGIPNCDTVKKARAWLDGQGLGYVFHDYKKEGVDPASRERPEGITDRPAEENPAIADDDRGCAQADRLGKPRCSHPAFLSQMRHPLY